MLTAGGVVFIAAATDNLIRAIDLRTGGRHFMETQLGDELIAYALPAS